MITGVSFIQQPLIDDENLTDVTQAELFTDKVMFQSLIHNMFTHVHQHPSSLANVPSDVSPKGDHMKRTITLG